VKKNLSYQRVCILAAILLCSLNANQAAADVEFQTSFGYSILGKLDAGTEASVQAIPISLSLNYERKFFTLSRFMAGVVLQHQFISYQQDGAEFTGSNFLAGCGLGWNIMNFKNSFVRFEGYYYPYSVMTVTSETKATLNDETYSHSTLTTFTGSGTTEMRVAFVSEKRGGQFNRYERLRYGVYISQMMQSIAKSEVKIATSDQDLAPSNVVTKNVDYSLNLTSVGLSVGFAF
jgi:hypothetical protein